MSTTLTTGADLVGWRGRLGWSTARAASPEAERLLRAAVERRRGGYVGGREGMPAAGEDLVAWRAREEAWHAAIGGEPGAPLDVVAAAVEAELDRR